MNSIKNNNLIIVAAVFIVLMTAALYFGFSSPGTTASVVTSVSTINYDSNSGAVKDGYLYGSKTTINAVLNTDPLELRILTKGTQTTWGTYTIKPQNNMLIKTSASSKAESPLQEYRRAYYKDSNSNVLQTKELKGASAWQVYTPIHIEIFADEKTIPTTKILSKDILGTDLDGQQLIALGNGFNIQKVANANTGGLQLPTVDHIVVATAPKYADLTSKVLSAYTGGKSYIFDMSSYDSRVDFFLEETSGKINQYFNDPLMVLWTGYDRFEFWGNGQCTGLTPHPNGYCKLIGWNGLYKEVNSPSYPIRYDPMKTDSAPVGKIIADPIQYGAQVNIEIPSEYMQSLAVLRGAGNPDVTFSVTSSMTQGSQYYLTVTVDNTGDTDGFSIVPTAKSGKILFSPASYTSLNIPAGGTKTVQFVMSVAGQEKSVLSAQESVELTVTPEHNIEARVTKTFTESIDYKNTNENNPDTDSNAKPTPIINPGDSDTMNLTNGKTIRGDNIKWYETGSAAILAFLMIGFVITAVYRKRMVK